MQIKSFRATTMKEAIAAVKAELGPNAVVLSTRSVKSRAGILARPDVEVTAAFDPTRGRFAAPDSNPGTPRPASETAPAPGSAVTLAALAERIGRIESGVLDDSVHTRLDRLSRRIDEIMERIDTAALKPNVDSAIGSIPPVLDGLLARLINAGVEDDRAADIIDRAMARASAKDLDDEFLALDLVAAEVMARVETKDPFHDVGKRRIVCALVGPTGSGKTTTIAKLAAAQVFDRGKKAAFITIDTFRIGAVEQLRTYARILGAPLDVAVDERDLTEKIAKHTEKDVVFIDTAGASQKDAQMMRRTAGYFEGVAGMDVHLIVSATTQTQDLYDIADNYRILPVSTVIASKLDECNAVGGILNLLDREKKPVSFFTIGQNVPDDIESATRERLADKLLGITAH